MEKENIEDRIVVVTCKMCGGGKDGEETACLGSIRSIVENGKIAFMIYSAHVEEKIKSYTFGYKIHYRYSDDGNNIPLGMWITKGDIIINAK
jgi:hypothetical protein